MVRVPAVLISAPFNKNPEAALIVPVTERLPVVPVSVRVSKVLGVPSASLMVSVPLVPAVAKVRLGALFERMNGLAPEKVLAWVKVLA